MLSRRDFLQVAEAGAGVTRHPDYPKWAWCSALTYDTLEKDY